jgi:hypothetical protein
MSSASFHGGEMNTVLQELVAGVRRAAAAHASIIPESDAVLASSLMDHYRNCSACRAPIDFAPEVMVHVCQSREEFLYRYGSAMTAHLESSPQCDGWFDDLRNDPYVQREAKRNKMKFDAEQRAQRRREKKAQRRRKNR